MNNIPLQTTCVGRLLIDLPKGGATAWHQQFDRAEVRRLENSAHSSDAFWSLVEKRRAQLESQSHRKESSLLTAYKVVGANAALLLHRESEIDDFGYDLDRYVWLGQHGYLFLTKAIPNEQRELLDSYAKIFSHLAASESSDNIGKPGFCIDRALVIGNVGSILASVDSSIPDWKGVSLSIGTSERGAASTLGEELAVSPFADLAQAEQEHDLMKGDAPGDVRAFTTLLRRERNAAGYPGQETGYRVTFNNERLAYQLEWQTHLADGGSSERPAISVSLSFSDSSANENPNLLPPSEEKLFALWNAVLGSIRLRPG